MVKIGISAVFASCYSFLVLFATTNAAIVVPNSVPNNTSPPILEAFISYSLEFVFFPDFAGTRAAPNAFSNNLLNNLGNLTGTKPYIRVGGNTQDYALYDASLQTATKGTYNNTRSPDYPTTVSIGPSFFDSYNTFPDTKYIHGFNLGLALTNAGWQTLLDTVPLACKAIGDKLLWWEYGNEPDLFSTSAQGPVRPSGWHESQLVEQWLNGTRAIKAQLQKYCPDMLGEKYGFLAPSFAGTNNHLKPVLTWKDGLNADGTVKIFSSHNYIGGATSPGITLQGTLLNHTRTVQSLTAQTTVMQNLGLPASIPFILGETNSLFNQGKPGLSNAFGAALWNLDFNLYAASAGTRRAHMHMGTDYRYAAWQPVATTKTSIGTKPPYYGQVAAAAVIGRFERGEVRILNLPLEGQFESAYAAFVDGKLEKIVVLNMKAYNYTVNGNSSVLNPVKRPSQFFSFQVPEYTGEQVVVKRLMANGSDAVSGVTWDGWSYNWELERGKPVRLGNVTVGETVAKNSGVVSVEVADSSAAVMEFGGN